MQKKKPKQCAVLGPEQSYSYLVATTFHPASSLILCPTIERVFHSVTAGETEEGVVPLENMLQGSVRETMLCLRTHKVQIIEALVAPIHHCCAAQGKAYMTILSHPQALAQCSRFLAEQRSRHKALTVQETASTAQAMQQAAANDSIAAIGPVQAARHNGLHILATEIEDHPQNVTVFLRIQKMSDAQKAVHGKKDDDLRTSLIIVPAVDRPGLLADILSVFKVEDMNLTKIESIPTGKKLGEYQFYLELSGSEHDENMVRALTTLRAHHSVFVFGSYRVKHITLP